MCWQYLKWFMQRNPYCDNQLVESMMNRHHKVQRFFLDGR